MFCKASAQKARAIRSSRQALLPGGREAATRPAYSAANRAAVASAAHQARSKLAI